MPVSLRRRRPDSCLVLLTSEVFDALMDNDLWIGLAAPTKRAIGPQVQMHESQEISVIGDHPHLPPCPRRLESLATGTVFDHRHLAFTRYHTFPDVQAIEKLSYTESTEFLARVWARKIGCGHGYELPHRGTTAGNETLSARRD